MATKFSTPSDREFVMSRTFNAPRDLVFAAYTKPEHMKQWFSVEGWELTTCEVDLRPGGSYRYAWTGPDAAEMGFHGEFTEVEPPSRIVATEVFEGEYFEVMGGGTINTMTFEESGGKTTITLTSLYKSHEAMESARSTGMEGGANETWNHLEAYLETLRS
jgi:uncharacterized protein YndB with AHSA1/START domain